MLSTDTQKAVNLSDQERDEREFALRQEKSWCVQRIAQINRELKSLGVNPHNIWPSS